MPRPAPDAVCNSVDPRVKCAGRFDAGLRGDFLYSFEHRGWLWSAFREGQAMVWRSCPWCRQRLPDRWAIYERMRAGIDEED